MKTDWTGQGDEGREGALDRELERELSVALVQRAAVPAGFADRVLARAQAEMPPEQGGGRLLHWPVAQGWAGWAVAAGLLLGVMAGGGAWERQHRAAERCARATAQFEAAERITDQTLDRVRAQMERAGVPAEAAGDAIGR